MRISRCKHLLLLTLWLLSGFPNIAFSIDCNTDKIIANLQNTVSNIKTYNVTIITHFKGVKSESLVYGVTPNKLYLKQDLSTPQGNASTTTVFDGKYQWVDITTPESRQIYKINLNKTTKPNRPFDTSYNLYGTGLLSGEDYPGTLKNLINLYKLKAHCSKETTLLSGHIDKNKFKAYASSRNITNPDYINKFIKLFGYIELALEPNVSNIESYSMGAGKSKIDLTASFRKKTINQNVNTKLFQFKTPSGIVAADITDEILSR